MKTATIETAMKAIDEAKPVKEAWDGTIPPGKHIRQGDVMLCAPGAKGHVTLADGTRWKVETGKVLAEGEAIQVAVGQNIGARHIMTGGNGVTVYAPKKEYALVGPVIVVKPDCTGLLTHPEHRHFNIPPGTFQVTFQRDYMAEELARVRD